MGKNSGAGRASTRRKKDPSAPQLAAGRQYTANRQDAAQKRAELVARMKAKMQEQAAPQQPDDRPGQP
jgi:hypothetical protein